MADTLEFTEGEEVELRAGMMRRRHNNAILMRGQRFELTEDEAKRSDAHLVFAKVEELKEPDDGDLDAHGPVDLLPREPDYDNLKALLEGANVTRAKQILSDENWTADGLRIAEEAEKDGKNRATVLEYIEGRILETEEEADDEE